MSGHANIAAIRSARTARQNWPYSRATSKNMMAVEKTAKAIVFAKKAQPKKIERTRLYYR